MPKNAKKDKKNTKEKNVKKKRGRKPKGGKIVKKKTKKKDINHINNIILHLKCSTKELKNFNFNNNTMETFSLKERKKETIKFKEISDISENIIINKKETIKTMWEKLRKIKNNYHNNVSYKKSSCFWCTCSFTNNPIYIPKKYKSKYEVYGCFCSPECAVAYLKKEPIGDIIKWERYSLLNNFYSELYNYKKNIKPAPDPYYTLDKFYGNLTIQEYRKLLSNDRIYIIVDKPLIKMMPELYEDNNDMPLIYNDVLNKKVSKKKYVLERKNRKEKTLFF